MRVTKVKILLLGFEVTLVSSLPGATLLMPAQLVTQESLSPLRPCSISQGAFIAVPEIQDG